MTDIQLAPYLNKSGSSPTSGTPQLAPYLDKNAAPSYINEEHPDLPLSTREVAKNFSNTPQDMANYVTKNTGMETKVLDGEVYMRKPGEKNYYRLDPSGLDITSLKGIKEAGKDILDTGADLVGGLASSAGAVGGALLGTGALPLVGTTSGAMGGAAAGGAGAEYLRQKIGQWLGANQGVNTGDVVKSGVISGLLPGIGKVASVAEEAVGPALKYASKFAHLPLKKITVPLEYGAKFLGPPTGYAMKDYLMGMAPQAAANIIEDYNK